MTGRVVLLVAVAVVAVACGVVHGVPVATTTTTRTRTEELARRMVEGEMVFADLTTTSSLMRAGVVVHRSQMRYPNATKSDCGGKDMVCPMPYGVCCDKGKFCCPAGRPCVMSHGFASCAPSAAQNESATEADDFQRDRVGIQTAHAREQEAKDKENSKKLAVRAHEEDVKQHRDIVEEQEKQNEFQAEEKRKAGTRISERMEHKKRMKEVHDLEHSEEEKKFWERESRNKPSEWCQCKEVLVNFMQRGWAKCPHGYLIAGLHRRQSQQIGTFDQLKCCRPCRPIYHPAEAPVKTLAPPNVTANGTIVLPPRPKPKPSSKPLGLTCKVAGGDWKTAINKLGWTRCPKDAYLAGLYRTKCNKLQCIQNALCCSINDSAGSLDCAKTHGWTASLDVEGWSTTTNGTFLAGIYRSGDQVFNLEHGWECTAHAFDL
eukprot:TRINITY_DN2065_c0_g1_i1.p1 TRINITY_DN2065_c0_g1~~TRINITY_DN2065_c0_g1_i1.p1  ORF type:complete len:432 (+),score=187.86 TRINITY_DN2065_c0_g1_i1:33-1328(+)